MIKKGEGFMNFKQAHSTNFRAGRTKPIQFIVIHYTSNNGDTAKNNIDYYSRTPNLSASAHYFVDENEVWQSVKDGDTAWHCGSSNKYVHKTCRNDNAIGIELCSRKDATGKYYFKDEVVKRAAALTKDLMKKYNIPVTNVIRHYDVTGKTCPAPFVEDANAWADFKKSLVAPAPELTEPNDIVWELAHRGIVTDSAGMLAEMKENPNGRLYWLARKCVKYMCD